MIKARLLLYRMRTLQVEKNIMKNCETLEKMLRMAPEDRRKAGKIVARSFYKTLRRNGFSHGDIMSFAGHLLDGVIREMNKENGRKSAAGLGEIDAGKEARKIA